MQVKNNSPPAEGAIDKNDRITSIQKEADKIFAEYYRK
jgi:hypothetical protein